MICIRFVWTLHKTLKSIIQHVIGCVRNYSKNELFRLDRSLVCFGLFSKSFQPCGLPSQRSWTEDLPFLKGDSFKFLHIKGAIPQGLPTYLHTSSLHEWSSILITIHHLQLCWWRYLCTLYPSDYCPKLSNIFWQRNQTCNLAPKKSSNPVQ